MHSSKYNVMAAAVFYIFLCLQAGLELAGWVLHSRVWKHQTRPITSDPQASHSHRTRVIAVRPQEMQRQRHQASHVSVAPRAHATPQGRSPFSPPCSQTSCSSKQAYCRTLPHCKTASSALDAPDQSAATARCSGWSSPTQQQSHQPVA